MRLLAISGSLRRSSYNGALLDAAAAVSGPEVEVVFWNHHDEIPAYNEDHDVQPESLAVLKQEIRWADAVLFATPEYNGAVPGALKNTLDWVSRPFIENPLRGKTVAVIGASQGAFGATWAQAELRKILQTLGAFVRADELAVARAHEAFAPDGLLRDPAQQAVLTSILETLQAESCRRAA
jgi:chromate reductase, NAD(P)H dehydrogenase (quinone)